MQAIYTFDELSDDAKSKALEGFWDINVDYEWWEHIYGDAAEVGLEISGFQLEYGRISAKFVSDLRESCRFILKNHGRECDTWKTANKYLGEYGKALAKWRREQIEEYGQDEYSSYCLSDWMSEFESTSDFDYDLVVMDFAKELKEDYLSMLRGEYEYQTGAEQVGGSIIANGYPFLEDGTRAD